MEKKGGLTRKEQIERDKQEIERLQNRIKQNEAKEKEKERKERTKRLIELGAIVESRFSADAIFVLRNIAKDGLAPVEKWLVEHKAKVEQELAAASVNQPKPVPHEAPAEVQQSAPASAGSAPCTSKRPNGQ